MRYGAELRLLVVGGGIAGLTLAAALEQRGMHADVIERAHGYGGIGYVLGLWPAGLNVLYSLDLREDLARIGLPCGMYYARDLRDRLLLGANFDAFAQDGGNLFLGRADLIDALRKAVRGPVTFGRNTDDGMARMSVSRAPTVTELFTRIIHANCRDCLWTLSTRVLRRRS